MKNILITIVAFTGFTGVLNAQALFKDLVPGAHPLSSSLEEYMNVNGTLFFRGRTMASGNTTGVHKLWKSDGTPGNTALVKDSVAVTVQGGMKFCANVNGTLYYIVSHQFSFSATNSTELWKTDGGTPVLVKTLSHASGTGGGGSPRNFVAVGDKLFFNMGGNSHGRELWVSDGTDAGTMEVTDLAPGEIVPGVYYSGLGDAPMTAFNGKVYFAGSTSGMEYELYASDGTAAGTTLVHAIPGGNSLEPKDWLVHNNLLYFTGSDGNNDKFWVTDGTTTTQLYSGVTPMGKSVVFNDKVHFSLGNGDLWLTDGTVAGTAMITAAMGIAFKGANSAYLFSDNNQTDGTAGGMTAIPALVQGKASFMVLNDNMYTSVLNTGTFTATLWESDGTESGTSGLITGYVGNPFVFNDKVFFTNFDNDNGYELWVLDGSTAGMKNTDQQIAVYPNPSDGIFQVKTGDPEALVRVYNMVGEMIKEQRSETLDLSAQPKGIYLLDVAAKGTQFTQKIILK